MKWNAVAVVLMSVPALALASGEIDQPKVDRVKVNIVESSDRFTGTSVVAAKRPIGLDGVGFLTTLTLNPAVMKKDGGKPAFYAVMSYTGYGWLFLSGGVNVLVDGARFELQGLANPSDRTVASCAPAAGCLVEEKVRFVVTKELADAIANARSAEIRAVGSRSSVDGRLNEKHVAYFREMAARYRAMGGDYSSDDAAAGTDRSGGAPPSPANSVARDGDDQEGAPIEAAAQSPAWREWGKK